MLLLIDTCHRREAPATTGMVPYVLSAAPSSKERQEYRRKSEAGKLAEANAGSDGALVYDKALVSIVQRVSYAN